LKTVRSSVIKELAPSERLVLSIITSRVALLAPVRTVSLRSTASPTLIWVPPEPATRITSFCTTAASPTRAGACAQALPISDETQIVSAAIM
jgi:hypothetical protein